MMKKVLLGVLNVIGKTILTICIVPLVIIGTLLLSLIRLAICLAVLVYKPLRSHFAYNREVPIAS